MTLVKPSAHMSQEVEVALETTLEQRILAELGDIKESQSFMRIMLLGGVYRDVQHEGKLPVLDATIRMQTAHIELCEKRVKLLEDDKIERDSSLRTTTWICGILATCGASLATIVVNLIQKH